jgi:hypothetical protein
MNAFPGKTDTPKMRDYGKNLEMTKAFMQNDFSRAIDMAKVSLASDRGDSFVYSLRASASFMTGDLQASMHDLHLMAGFLHDLVNSGDGTSAESPFIISDPGEYWIFLTLLTGISVSETNVPLFPPIPFSVVTKLRNGRERTVWFQFSLPNQPTAFRTGACRWCSNERRPPGMEPKESSNLSQALAAELDFFTSLRASYTDKDASAADFAQMQMTGLLTVSGPIPSDFDMDRLEPAISRVLGGAGLGESEVHRILWQAAAACGDFQRAAHHLHYAFGLMHSVAESGSGRTRQDAFQIIGVWELSQFKFGPLQKYVEFQPNSRVETGRLHWRTTKGAEFLHYYEVGDGLRIPTARTNKCALCLAGQ